MSKILVTGATGFLGIHLLKRLLQEENIAIRAIKRPGRKPSVEDPRIEWVDGDLLDIGSLEDAFEGITDVYHTAAIVSFQPKDKWKMIKGNTDSTANIVNLCLDFNIRKLVYVSSVAALGRIKSRPEIDESATWEESPLNSNYGISKFRAEMEVWRGIEEGLNAVIVNPSIIIGAGNWKNSSPALFRQIWQGLNFYTPGTTGFVSVDDVTEIMVKLMHSNISAERFIVSAENLPYRSVFNMIADALGKKEPAKALPEWLGAVVWRGEALRAKISGKPPVITKETIRNAFSTSLYENAKIKKALSFEFTPVKTIIAETGKVFLQEHQ